MPERDEVPEDEPEHDVLAVERQQRLEERQRHRAQLRLAPDPQGQLQKESRSVIEHSPITTICSPVSNSFLQKATVTVMSTG